MIGRHHAVQVSSLPEIPDDPFLREEWNALVVQMRSPQVFYTYEWARAVQLAYGASLCPLLLLGRDEENKLIGVAALSAPRNAPVSFLCATTGDYCDFIATEDDVSAFAASVLETLRRAGTRTIALTNLPEDSPSYAVIRDSAYDFHAFARTAYLCAQVRMSKIPVENGELALPRQKMVRRSERAIAADGPLLTVNHANWEDVSPQLSEFFRAHIARFLFTGRLSNIVHPERCEFLSQLARLLSSTGWLHFTRMNGAGRNVAWNYGFKFNGTVFWYQPTFVSDLEKYSPGFVLLSRMIAEAGSDPLVKTVDLGLGAESYKEVFANAHRRTMHVTLHRSRLRYWAEIARFRAATAIMAKPTFEKIVRKLAAKMAALQRRVGRPGLGATCLWMIGRAKSAIASRDEVRFYEITPSDKKFLESHGTFLQPVLKAVDMNTLADAAMQNSADNETLTYLLRCAGRLRQRNAEGFALVDPVGRFLHFGWMAAFDGLFLSELEATIEAPAPNSVIIFDCWTPPSQRGRGYYAETVSLIAEQAWKQGKAPWTFVAARNSSAIQGLEKSGFQQRYSLIRQRALWWQRIKGNAPRFVKASAVGASAGV